MTVAVTPACGCSSAGTCRDGQRHRSEKGKPEPGREGARGRDKRCARPDVCRAELIRQELRCFQGEDKKKGQIQTSKSLKPEWKWLRGVSQCQADPRAISICFLICFEPCLSFVLTAPGGRRCFPASLPCCCLMDRHIGDALGDPCFLRREEGLAGCPETEASDFSISNSGEMGHNGRTHQWALQPCRQPGTPLSLPREGARGDGQPGQGAASLACPCFAC